MFSCVMWTRYETIVQVRCLLEGVEVQDMLDNWGTLLPHYMEHWSLDRGEVRHTTPQTTPQGSNT